MGVKRFLVTLPWHTAFTARHTRFLRTACSEVVTVAERCLPCEIDHAPPIAVARLTPMAGSDDQRAGVPGSRYADWECVPAPQGHGSWGRRWRGEVARVAATSA